MGDQSAYPLVASLQILLLEDSAFDAELVTEALAEAGLAVSVERVVSSPEFAQALEGRHWDLILADYALPGFDGLSALAAARASRPETPFVFVSGALGEEVAVEALKRGATDYVLKQRLDRLPIIVLRALAESREREERRRAEEALHRLLIERTALLHELDHRVKNNLQLLLSLIGIEIRQAPDEQTRHVLGRVRERMHALAAAHRDLYDGQDAGRFNVTRFVRGLCEELTASSTHAVAFDWDVQAVDIDASKAASIALLFNEIVAGALAHTNGNRRLRTVLALRDGLLSFELHDEAPRIGDTLPVGEAASNTVLKALSRQLDATVDWPQDGTLTIVRVTIPVEEVGQS